MRRGFSAYGLLAESCKRTSAASWLDPTLGIVLPGWKIPVSLTFKPFSLAILSRHSPDFEAFQNRLRFFSGKNLSFTFYKRGYDFILYVVQFRQIRGFLIHYLQKIITVFGRETLLISFFCKSRSASERFLTDANSCGGLFIGKKSES